MQRTIANARFDAVLARAGAATKALLRPAPDGGWELRNRTSPKFDLPSRLRIFWGMDHLERITLEPDKRAGKPCIRGLRITVYDVLEYLASGMTEEEILADFPDLEPEDIRAVLAFAAARERRLISIPAG